MRRRSALAAAPVVVVALVLAAPAGAETFCVQDPACPATPQPALQAALDAAAVNVDDRDTIRVGPAALTESAIDTAGNKVDIVGAGADRTSVAQAAATALTIAEPSSTVAGLEVRLTAGSGKTAFVLKGAATDVAVTGSPGVTASSGVRLSGGAAFRGGSVTMPATADAAANDGALVAGPADPGEKTIDGATIVASTGVRVSIPMALGSFVTVRRARITARSGVGVEQGQAIVDDSLVRVLPAEAGSAPVALSAIAASTDLRATNVTAIGPVPGSSSVGAVATSGGAVELRNTIVRGFEKDVRNEPGSTLAASRSAFETSQGTIGGVGNTAAAPSFVDPAGDFRLRWDSPLRDAGGVFPGPDTDVDGNPRTINGAPDIGAFEYQRRPPVPAIAVALGTPRVNDPVGFDAGGSSDPDPADAPLSFAWSFDDGGTDARASVAHVFTTPGSHTATLTVTDPAGVSASLSRIVVVAAKGGGELLPPVPALSAFSAKTVKPREKKGTTFRYALSAAARSVKLSFDALLPGKRSGRSCVKPTRRLGRAKGCTRIVAKGGISGPATAGKQSVKWDGRVKRKALPAGRYRVTARGTDRFGRLTNSRTLTLTILASR